MRQKTKLVQIIADSQIGGGTKHVLELLRHIDKEKFECYLLAPAGYLTEEAQKIKNVTVEMIRMKSKFDLASIYRIKKKLEEIESRGFPFTPLIAHSHGPRAGLFTSLIAPKAAVKIYTEHRWGENYRLKNWLNDFSQRKLLRWIYGRSNTVVAVSEGVKGFLIKQKFIKSGKITVIPNGIDLAEFDKKKINESNKAPVIGTVGSLFEIKGQKYLIEAMKEILESYPLATLEIVGEGPERENLKKLVHKLGLEKNVSFLGQKRGIAKIICGFDVFVLPSLAETFGIVVLEAFACGVPVVATRVDGVSDIIENGESGILVKPGDSRAIARGAIEILDHPVRAAKLKQGGLKRVKLFEWTKVAKDIEELYGKLVS